MSNIYENKGAFGATIVVAASDSLNPRQANYICDGTNDEVEIQAALDALPATGGEVKLLDGTYNLYSAGYYPAFSFSNNNQTLRGCGRNTILDCTNCYYMSINGYYHSRLMLADLRVTGCPGMGLYFYSCSQLTIINVESDSHGSSDGITLETCSNSKVIACDCHDCNGAGITVSGSNYITISDNLCNDNSYGINISIIYNGEIVGNICCSNVTGFASSQIMEVTIAGNVFAENTSDGMVLGKTNSCLISSNIASENTDKGIELGRASNTSDDNLVIGNVCDSNGEGDATDTGIEIYGDRNHIEGNECSNNNRYGILVTSGSKNSLDGNRFYNNTTLALSDNGTLTQVEDTNQGIHLFDIKVYRLIYNNSGAQRVAGDVISIQSGADINSMTTPAAVGERQVYGMVAETINNTSWGLALVKGYTTVLKSTNVGGGNIVAGDHLITENGVRARKAAAATDPIFAKALGACAAANCTINAFIKSPWD